MSAKKAHEPYSHIVRIGECSQRNATRINARGVVARAKAYCNRADSAVEIAVASSHNKIKMNVHLMYGHFTEVDIKFTDIVGRKPIF